MRTGSYVDALDESFEYMVSSPTPQYILDYYASEAQQGRAARLITAEPTPSTTAPTDTFMTRLAAQARSLFTLFKRQQ